MFFKSKEQRKIDILEKTITEIIDDFENRLCDSNVRCKDVLLKNICPLLQRSILEAKEWEKDFDYINTAYCILYNASFDLLTSGRFHLFRGVLNEMNESRHLYKFCIHHLDRAVELNFLSKEEKADELKHLHDCIKNVG